MLRIFCAAMIFISLAAAQTLQASNEALWRLENGFLHRQYTPTGLAEETTKWRFSRISWFPFIAWEEKRLRGGLLTEVWIDTPGKLRYMKTKAGRVLRMQSFKKGDRIPKSLRPRGQKILWVILADELVRKVFHGDVATFEFRYDKTKVPLHPFVMTQELAKARRASRTVVFKTDNRTVVAKLSKGRVTDLQVGWLSSEEKFRLPPKDKHVRRVVRKTPPRKIVGPETPKRKKKKKPRHDSLAAARALLAQGQAHPSLVMLKKLAKRYPRNEKVVYYEGMATFTLGRLAEAQRYFDKARMLAPGWPLPVIASAELLAFRNRSVKAIQLLDSLGATGDIPEAHRVRAILLASTRDFRGALEAGLKALPSMKDDCSLLFILARAGEGLQMRSEARDYYRQTLQSAKGKNLSLLPHSLLNHELGKGADSLEALTITPGKPFPIYFAAAYILGAMEYGQGNLQAAARAFTQAHLARPQNEGALYNCALILSKLAGRREEGVNLFKRLLALSPHHVRAKTRLAALTKKTQTRNKSGDNISHFKYRGPSHLDRLFKSVKQRLDGEESVIAKVKKSSPSLNTPKLTAIEMRTRHLETNGIHERTLAASRDTLPEIRLGGRGEIAAPLGCVIRLEPKLSVPRQFGALIDEEVQLSLVGRLACGRAEKLIISLGFSPIGSTKPNCSTKSVLKANEISGTIPIELQLSTRLAGDVMRKPEFTVHIAAQGKDAKETVLADHAIRLRYSLEEDTIMKRSQES